MEILRYVQSEDFGKFGESNKLIENITVRAYQPLNPFLATYLSFVMRIGVYEQTGYRECETGRGEPNSADKQ